MSEGDEANGDLRRHDLILSVRDGPSGSTNMAPETGQVYRLSAIPLVPIDGVEQGGVERLSSRLGPRMIFQPQATLLMGKEIRNSALLMSGFLSPFIVLIIVLATLEYKGIIQ
jgi:hypothetical protein